MSEPFLIAHKVRGAPAFDIAEQILCPECQGAECPECDQTGHWWVVTTSGHRAYPWHTISLHTIEGLGLGFEAEFGPMPEGLPDHYNSHAAPATSRPSSLTALLAKRAPAGPPINRRGF